MFRANILLTLPNLSLSMVQKQAEKTKKINQTMKFQVKKLLDIEEGCLGILLLLLCERVVA